MQPPSMFAIDFFFYHYLIKSLRCTCIFKIHFRHRRQLETDGSQAARSCHADRVRRTYKVCETLPRSLPRLLPVFKAISSESTRSREQITRLRGGQNRIIKWFQQLQTRGSTAKRNLSAEQITLVLIMGAARASERGKPLPEIKIRTSPFARFKSSVTWIRTWEKKGCVSCEIQ